MKNKITLLHLCVFFGSLFFISSKIFAQGVQKPAHHYYTFISVGTGYSFINGNNDHLSDLKPLVGYYITAKEEWQYTEKINFLLGLDFVSSACKFNSYYFTNPDSAIYDKNFSNGYKLRFNQFNVPILIRINYFDKKKDKHCFYTDIGPALQFLMPARLEVKGADGKTITSGAGYTVFDNISAGVFSNLMINGSAGVQFYKGTSHWGWDVEMNFRFSPNALKLKENFAAKDLYFRQFMIGISTGIRF
ncbi:MAG: hypothetical protein ACK5D5_06385 [Bacteroidota bacterium]|jgi:hypothetical protein